VAFLLTIAFEQKFRTEKGSAMPSNVKTKSQIVQAIRECAEQLGRSPSLRELLRLKGVSEHNLQAECGSLKHGLKLAGVSSTGRGYNLSDADLLLDWARIARKLGKIPTVAEYETNGRFTNMPFNKRYQRWALVPQAFREFCKKGAVESQWQDVLEMVSRKLSDAERTAARPKREPRRKPLYKDRPVYGAPLLMPELAYEPITEDMVIFLFGALARKLGFLVYRIQPGYPDCQAAREMAKGQWQDVDIEFEVESRNFLKHRHNKNGCDMIVCWKHNWPECPKNIEVLELSRFVGQIG
jgi:hypothetical protein